MSAASSPTWIFPRAGAGTAGRVVPTAAPHCAAPHRAARWAFLAGLLLACELVFRPAFGLTGSDVAFACAFGCAVVGIALSERPFTGSIPAGVLAGVGLFVAGACVSAFGADGGGGLGVVARFVVLTLVWFWLATVLLRRMSDVYAAVTCWAVSAAVSGAAAIAQLFGGVIPDTEVAWGRMTGTAQHVNDLGGSAAVALPAAAALALAPFLGGGRRLLAVGATALITSGLVLSGSVGSVVAAGCGLVVTAAVARRRRALAAVTTLVLPAGALIWHLQSSKLSSTLSDRVGSVSSPTGTFNERLSVFGDAWRVIEQNPLVGNGFGFDPRLAGSALPDLIHNAFLSVWYQGGLLAVAGLALVCGAILLVGRRAVAGARTEGERLLAASLVGSFVAYLVFGLGEPTLYARYGWIPAALLLALEGIRRHPLSPEGPE